VPKARKFASPFAYCVELEYALSELYGAEGKWNGLAGSFQNHIHVRRAILDACKAIRKRLNNMLTSDDRLRLLTSIQLEAIERSVRYLGYARCEGHWNKDAWQLRPAAQGQTHKRSGPVSF
jgi:hypothetical protein